MTIATSTIIKTKYGRFKVCYHEFKNESCLSFSKGNLTRINTIVRIHSACLFGEVFQSLHCDCYIQLKKAIDLIRKNKNGVIIYSYQEGRGIGLKNKIKSMEISRKKNIDTVDAFIELGFTKPDYRSYQVEINALKELNINKKIRLLSGNPLKIRTLKKAGYEIENILENVQGLNKLAKNGRRAKIKKLGYKY